MLEFTLNSIRRHGIPEGVRGNVWKLLLGVTKPNKCTFPDFDLCLMLNVIAKKIGPATELELFRKHKEEYKELLSKEAFYNERRIRNQVGAYLASKLPSMIISLQIRRYRRNVEVLKKEEVQESVAHVIHAYLVHEQQTEVRLLRYLCHSVNLDLGRVDISRPRLYGSSFRSVRGRSTRGAMERIS